MIWVLILGLLSPHTRPRHIHLLVQYCLSAYWMLIQGQRCAGAGAQSKAASGPALLAFSRAKILTPRIYL